MTSSSRMLISFRLGLLRVQGICTVIGPKGNRVNRIVGSC